MQSEIQLKSIPAASSLPPSLTETLLSALGGCAAVAVLGFLLSLESWVIAVLH